MDDITIKIKDMFCVRYHQDSNVSLEDIFNKTDLLNTCRLYTKKASEGEKVTFVVKDVLDVVADITWKSDDLAAINGYVSLFSEDGPAYELKQLFDKKKLSNDFKYATFEIHRSLLKTDKAYCSKGLKSVLELLGSEQALAVFSRYHHYNIPPSLVYEAVIGKAMPDVSQAKELLACLDDERVYNIFADERLTFPEDTWYKLSGYSKDEFVQLVMARAYQTHDPEAVVEFANGTREAWVSYFGEHP